MNYYKNLESSYEPEKKGTSSNKVTKELNIYINANKILGFNFN